MNGPPGYVLSAGPGWIAVDKPAGLSVHNDPQGDALSVMKFCLAQDDELAKVSSFDGTLSPAHRLDKETSGVLVFATTKASASRLQTAFADSATRATKIYVAVVKGSVSDSGTWSWPISDKAESRDNPAGKSTDRKESITHFAVARANRYLSELTIDLGTGRQHQIRKHAAIAKHPVVGDKRYGDSKHAKLMQEKFSVSRMLLHAKSLELRAGETTIEVEAPLPPEFAKVFEEVAR